MSRYNDFARKQAVAPRLSKRALADLRAAEAAPKLWAVLSPYGPPRRFATWWDAFEEASCLARTITGKPSIEVRHDDGRRRLVHADESWTRIEEAEVPA